MTSFGTGLLADNQLTCAVLCLETSPLHRSIRVKPEEHLVGRSHYRVWFLAATEAAKDR